MSVDPILEPKITPIACLKVINCALTKDTTMTVVTVELCKIIVITRPTKKELKELFVNFDIIFRTTSVPIASKDWDKVFNPKKKTAIPPKTAINTLTWIPSNRQTL